MVIEAGSQMQISFDIEGNIVFTTATFTGELINLHGKKVYIVLLQSGKEYGFTQEQLDTFAPLNDKANRETVDSITLGS